MARPPMSSSRFLWFLAAVGAGCSDPAPATPELPDATIAEPSPAPTGSIAAGVCIPATCSFIVGDPAGCGLIDDGCGGTAWCGSCACGSTAVACELDMPVIAEATYVLSPSQTLTAETTGLSSGADSVLHIIESNGTQLAFNDDRATGNRASKVTYTAPWFGYKTVRIVARAKSATTTGTATLTYNGNVVAIALSYPTRTLSSSRSGDQLQTALVPGDAANLVIYTLSGANITGRAVGTSATAGGASLALPSSGTTTYLLGRTGLSGAPAHGRMLRNDAGIPGHDPDADGLGSNLETALGTCSARSGSATDRFGATFSCSLAADARDTDGDGLHDGWEVRGKLDGSPALALPRWGADPRHKDMFVEIDFAQSSFREPEAAVTEAELLSWAKYAGDRISLLSAAKRAAHVADLRNPDGKVGISVHFDAGLNPTDPRWRALYGDWGGHDVVPPAVDPDDGSVGRMSPSAARASYMDPSRRGVFRYAERTNGGGGQAPGLSFVYNGTGRTGAHESGHTAELMHDGLTNPLISLNCKPNYASLMNYGFDSTGVGFSDGAGAPALNNAFLVESRVADPALYPAFLAALRDFYDYDVDDQTGDVDWNRDGVIAPPGETVRAYANNRQGDSCESTRAGATIMADSRPTLRAPALAHQGGRTFLFTAQSGHVNWTYTTSALACSAPNGQECAAFGGIGQLAGLDSDLGVDAVRLPSTGEVLVVGVSDTNTVRWARLTGVASGQPQFTAVSSLVGTAVLDQPSLAIAEDGAPELFYRDASGALFSRRYVRSTDTWSDAAAVLNEAGAQVTMSVVGAPGAVLAPPLDSPLSAAVMNMVFAAPSTDCMELWYRLPSGRWRRDFHMPTCNRTQGRPAIAWVPDAKNVTLGGRLHIVHTPRNDDPDHSAVRQFTSVADFGRIAMGVESMYDNSWLYSYGVDLLYEAGIDDNLRSATTRSYASDDESLHGTVRFDPKADGISNYTYENSNDWRTMRWGLCQKLADEQGLGLTCASPP